MNFITRNRKAIFATIAFLVIIIIMLLVYRNYTTKHAGVVGDKKVTVQIVIPDKDPNEVIIQTNTATLKEALDEKNLIQGYDGDYGFYITEVDGRVADDNKQEWWCITKGGENVYTGISQTPIEDGDQYEITLMIGY